MTATMDTGLGTGSSGGDAVIGHLAEVLTTLRDLAHGTGRVDDATRVDRIGLLERIKAAAAAAQAAEIVAFARSQVAQQRDAGVDYRRLGHGIAEQIGLATRTSGWHGARSLRWPVI